MVIWINIEYFGSVDISFIAVYFLHPVLWSNTVKAKTVRALSKCLHCIRTCICLVTVPSGCLSFVLNFHTEQSFRLLSLSMQSFVLKNNIVHAQG
jgi:hypothetical protein